MRTALASVAWEKGRQPLAYAQRWLAPYLYAFYGTGIVRRQMLQTDDAAKMSRTGRPLGGERPAGLDPINASMSLVKRGAGVQMRRIRPGPTASAKRRPVTVRR